METVHINGVNSIKGEINSILTLLRLNTRWSSSSSKFRINSNQKSESNIPQSDYDILDENPLVGPFRKLNKLLEGVYDLHHVHTVAYISPFHNIIVSEQASGPLTSTALGSLVKFVSYGFLSPHFPGAKEGILLVSNCISGCIFEETDWESDEVILMKLLELSTLVYRSDAAKLLTVCSAWEIYSTCISIHSQYRASKILKSEAESALRNLTLTAFSRAHLSKVPTLDSEDGSTLTDNTESDFLQIMKDKTWESASSNYYFEGPVGIPLLLGKIMTVLSGLMDLQTQPVQTVRFSLALVNIALEAGGPSQGSIPILVEILRGDICRHLLKASQSDNLEIFSLALRVVFNLFMSIKDHVKIQLEVFLTSVHLRLLSASQLTIISLAKEELALESLLEFCREPSLMQDIYINYDCDVQCTNLFDAIITALCQRSLPDGFSLSSTSNSHLSENDALTFNIDNDSDSSTKKSGARTTILNHLALDGILSVLHAISNRCEAFDNSISCLPKLPREISWSSVDTLNNNDFPIDQSQSPKLSKSEVVTPTKNHDYAEHFLKSTDDHVRSPSSPMLISEDIKPLSRRTFQGNDSSGMSSDNDAESVDDYSKHSNTLVDDDDSDFVYQARAKTAEILRHRKLKKQKLRIAADKFNSQPMKPEWLRYASDNGLISSSLISPVSHFVSGPSYNATVGSLDSSINKTMATMHEIYNIVNPKDVARFLRNTPGLGKSQIGEFISKGPADLYPFHAAVLREYVDTFDFTGKYAVFDKALRLFLGHFRLPGEAQCIDRIMEAFAGKLFRDLGPNRPFKSADSAFILAFSTIMLNTDLHNPQIPVNKKMTMEQYIRNNRGINDGEDLPREFLEQLYNEIKSTQIQLDTDIVDFGASAIAHIDITDHEAWNKLIKKRASQNAPAVFTPTVAAREVALITGSRKHSQNIDNVAGDIDRQPSRLLLLPFSHEKDMFLVMANQVFEALMILWTHIEDDSVTSKLLDGTCDFINICISLNLPVMFDGVIKILATKTIAIIEYERLGDRSWSKQKMNKLRMEKKTSMSWDDYYDTASIIAEEKDTANNSILSKYSATIYREKLEQLLTAKLETITTIPLKRREVHSQQERNLGFGGGNVSSTKELNSVESIGAKQGNHEAIFSSSAGKREESKLISWVGSSKIRGEIILKLLLYFVEANPNQIAHEGWASMIAILLYARSLGVLPPPLALIYDEYDDYPSGAKIYLPLTLYGKCFLDGIDYRCVIDSSVRDTKILDITNADVKKNDKPKQSGLWGTLGSLLWSEGDNKNVEISKSQHDRVKPHTAHTVFTVLELCKSVHSKKPFAGLDNSRYSIVDGNCRNLRYREVSTDGQTHNALDQYIGGPEEMLRLVLLTGHVDEMIFINWKNDKIVLHIFDALSNYLHDVMSIILTPEQYAPRSVSPVNEKDLTTTSKSIISQGKFPPVHADTQRFSILIHAQSDAIMLIEWMSMIVKINPSITAVLWTKMFKVLRYIFESEIAVIASTAPYLLERSVCIILQLTLHLLSSENTRFGPSFHHSNPQINSDDNDTVWNALRFILIVPTQMFKEFGSRIGPGLLSLYRNCKDKSVFNNPGRWDVICKLMIASMNNQIGRIFIYELLNDIIDDNNVNDANIYLVNTVAYRLLEGNNDRLDINTLSREISQKIDPVSIDRSMPWLPCVLMNLLKITLMSLLPLTAKDSAFHKFMNEDSTAIIPLPKWIVDTPSVLFLSSLEKKRQPHYPSDKPKCLYRASVESMFIQELILLPTATNATYSKYCATHLSLQVTSSHSNIDGAHEWLNSCSLFARFVHFRSELTLTQRALYCLQILLEVGRNVDFSVNVWEQQIENLLNLLPANLSLSKSTDSGSVTVDKQGLISDDEAICVNCCNIFFDLIVQKMKVIRQSANFQSIWLRIVSNLSSNLNNPLRLSDYFKREILEMIFALLRLLKPSYRLSRMSSNSSPTAKATGSSLLSQSSQLTNQFPDNQSSILSDPNSKSKQSNTNNGGLFGLVSMMWGGSTPSTSKDPLKRPIVRELSKSDLNHQIPDMINHHDTEVVVDQNQSSVDIVATAAVTTISPSDHFTIESRVETSNQCPDHSFSASSDEQKEAGQPLTDSHPSATDIENGRLLALSWKTMTSICITLPAQLRTHNPNQMIDLIRTLEDVNHLLQDYQSVQYARPILPSTSNQHAVLLGESTPIEMIAASPSIDTRNRSIEVPIGNQLRSPNDVNLNKTEVNVSDANEIKLGTPMKAPVLRPSVSARSPLYSEVSQSNDEVSKYVELSSIPELYMSPIKPNPSNVKPRKPSLILSKIQTV